jgi:uncharacterized membrane protein YeaQ/YmgE (transglycosylase-associated protein family)
MDLIMTVLIGLAIGSVVELLRPGQTGFEFILGMLLGVVGALLARYIGQKAGWFGTKEPDCFIASGMGSVAVLTIYALFLSKRKKLHR